MLSANGYRSGLLTDTGKVYLWGRSAQLTNGEKEDFEPPFYILSPTLVPHIRFSNNDIIKKSSDESEEKIISLCVGLYHTGVVTDMGHLYMWGHNKFGQLGDLTKLHRLVPTLISPNVFGGKKVFTASIGSYHSGILTDDGDLYMWGYNMGGGVGVGYIYSIEPIPVLISQKLFGGERIVALYLNNFMSSAITETGKLYLWGKLPKLIHPDNFGGEKVLMFRNSSEHYGVITEIGHVYMWGDNSYGGLGVGENFEYGENKLKYSPGSTVPILLPQSYFDNEKVIALDLKWENSAAITESGKLYMWGRNEYGEFGLGDNKIHHIPTLISPSIFGNTKVVEVSLGWHHTLVRTSDNKIYASGYNKYGQLGLGDTINRNTFELVADLEILR